MKLPRLVLPAFLIAALAWPAIAQQAPDLEDPAVKAITEKIVAACATTGPQCTAVVNDSVTVLMRDFGIDANSAVSVIVTSIVATYNDALAAGAPLPAWIAAATEGLSSVAQSMGLAEVATGLTDLVQAMETGQAINAAAFAAILPTLPPLRAASPA